MSGGRGDKIGDMKEDDPSASRRMDNREGKLDGSSKRKLSGPLERGMGRFRRENNGTGNGKAGVGNGKANDGKRRFYE